MTVLWMALAAFVVTHFVLSHPLRAPLVARLGERGFQGLYSVVALVTLGGAGHAFGRMRLAGDPAWAVGDGLWALATALMWFGSVLLAGSFVRNPALPAKGAPIIPQRPHGVFRITRHPMMWAIALWALSHLLVSPRPAQVALSVAFLVLALVGSAGQDAKKARLNGADWRRWLRQTSFVPFGRCLASPGVGALVAGTLLWLAATWLHPTLGGQVAGIWRWVAL